MSTRTPRGRGAKSPRGGVAPFEPSPHLATSSPGSGSAQCSLQSDLSRCQPISAIDFDQVLGMAIAQRALITPSRAMLTKAGEEARVIVGTPNELARGYDAGQGEWGICDMIKAGIVIVRLLRTALVEASGMASLLTTSETCVVGAPEEDKAASSAGMAGMGGIGGIVETSAESTQTNVAESLSAEKLASDQRSKGIINSPPFGQRPLKDKRHQWPNN